MFFFFFFKVVYIIVIPLNKGSKMNIEVVKTDILRSSDRCLKLLKDIMGITNQGLIQKLSSRQGREKRCMLMQERDFTEVFSQTF